MEFTIQQATINHLEELTEVFDLYRMFYNQQSDKERAKAFLFHHFENRTSIIFIAINPVSGRIAGFTQLYPVYSSVSMQRVYILNDLFVREEHRKAGLGKHLLDAAKEYAIATKAKGLQLETAPDNIGAQKLYERYGFQKDNEFFHYFLSLA